MADKTPDSVVVTNLGENKLVVAHFDGTTDLDDNDAWVSGITSMIAYWSEQTTEGPNDMVFDAYARSTGTFTYGGKSSNTGYLFVVCRDN